MPEPQKRQVAYKVTISQILSGKYVKEEGWIPNYIELKNGGQVSRVNLLAAVITKQTGEHGSQEILVDDGTGSIILRNFENLSLFDKIKKSEIVQIIGRPREYNNEKYIMPEIIKKIENPSWVEIRKSELINSRTTEKATISKEVIKHAPEIEEPKKEIENNENESNSEKIIEKIKELDKGDGANFDEIIKNIKNGESLINALLKEGEIFELSPGKLKILE